MEVWRGELALKVPGDSMVIDVNVRGAAPPVHPRDDPCQELESSMPGRHERAAHVHDVVLEEAERERSRSCQERGDPGCWQRRLVDVTAELAESQDQGCARCELGQLLCERECEELFRRGRGRRQVFLARYPSFKEGLVDIRLVKSRGIRRDIRRRIILAIRGNDGGGIVIGKLKVTISRCRCGSHEWRNQSIAPLRPLIRGPSKPDGPLACSATLSCCRR